MALFMKQPIVQEQTPLYTLSSNRNLLIVGLGNPEKQYDGTRHNIGFAALDHFAEDNDFDPWVNKKDLQCLLTQKTLGQTRVILVKPTTYMNLSGEAVQAAASFYKIPPESVIIVHDELDIHFGQIRTRNGGSAAGNNGLKSVIKHGYEASGRVRIGIGPKAHEQQDSADFVLGKFTTAEQGSLKHLYGEVDSILTETIYGDGTLFPETRSF